MSIIPPAKSLSIPVHLHAPNESLLVFSDVHLGSDLNDRFFDRENRRTQLIDRDLIELLAHYRQAKPQGERWRIVIAGDFIDFIGMTIDASSPDVSTELSEEEREHGLGNASDHAREKLRRVVVRHRDVFEALASFVADGHALTLVHGNHDVEFHWDVVKDEFRAALADCLQELQDEARAEFIDRIEFCPWFFYRNNVAYIEHGHQYDRFCATDHVMAPVSPMDSRRVARGFCDVLIRFVVRPTSGLKTHGHESKGVVDYLRFGMRLGLRGGLRLGHRYARAVIELFRVRRGYFTGATAALREEHERRMKLFAEATRIGMDRLRALVALQSPPITRSVHGILASLLLDRIALALFATLALVVLSAFEAYRGHGFLAMGAVVLAWVVAHRHLSKLRKVDPAEEMIDRATRLASLFPAAFVVMGHTHVPVRLPINQGASTYINLGSWAEEEAVNDEEEARAARTHLVIHVQNSVPVAEFFTWTSAEGPIRFVTTETKHS